MITNPIELGENIDTKDYILDIRVELNRKILINLEMQIVNEGNWVERSLCYLCRAFDNLTRGRERLLRETLRENAKLTSEKERLSSQNELLRRKLAELGFDADNLE